MRGAGFSSKSEHSRIDQRVIGRHVGEAIFLARPAEYAPSVGFRLSLSDDPSGLNNRWRVYPEPMFDLLAPYVPLPHEPLRRL